AKVYTDAELRYFLRSWVEQETRALAVGMSIKTAVANLPYGGGKGTILFADVFEQGGRRVIADFPTTDAVFRARVIRNYVRDLYQKGKIGYNIDVPAPDTGSRATDMDIMTDELLRLYITAALREGVVDQWEDRNFAARIAEVHRQATTTTHPENALLNTPYLTAVSEYLATVRKQGRQGPGALPAFARPLARLTSVFTSKTVRHGGSEFRDNSTGYGVVFTLKEALKREEGLKAALRAEGKPVTNAAPLTGLTVKVIGFGGVGIPAIEQFIREGAKVQHISEGARGIVSKPEGFTLDDIQTLRRLRAETGGFQGINTAGYLVDGATLRTGEGAAEYFLSAPTDVFVPAALENMVNGDNVDLIQTKIIAEGANGAVTNGAYYSFINTGGFVISDVLANGGGVTVSYLEWQQNLNNEQWNADAVRARQEQLQADAVRAVYEVRGQFNTDLRTAIDIYPFRQILSARDLPAPTAAARLAQESELAREPNFTTEETESLALFGIRTSAAIDLPSGQRPVLVPYLLGNRLVVVTLALDPVGRSVSVRLGAPRDLTRPFDLVDIAPARTVEQRTARVALSEAPQLQKAAARLAAEPVDTASARLTEAVRDLIAAEKDLGALPSVRHMTNQGSQQLFVQGVKAFTSFAGSKTGRVRGLLRDPVRSGRLAQGAGPGASCAYLEPRTRGP
ncbi:MAG: Glu/Leu/Phe/Val dehydrogenase, partial [Candidatus Eisenbacteria bacterium]|nr:Glu/Leu/Phe/Val dehydrogenase [Candidatus Eisenbacteria bacterium]